MTEGNFLRFSTERLFLNGRSFEAPDRPYLPPIYAAACGNLVLRCGRQVEKSTLLANLIAYLAVTVPRIRILVVFPREEQLHVFNDSRLTPLINESPLVRAHLFGSGRRRSVSEKVRHKKFANGSEVYLRSAYLTSDAARGLSVDVLILDEFQDIADGVLPVLTETMSHSPRQQTVITGTPKSVDNHLEGVFNRSSAEEWHVTCQDCGRVQILSDEYLTFQGYVCPGCTGLIDVRQGNWIPRNPDSRWGRGFCINQAMTPWTNHCRLLSKREEYDPIQFRNECWGQPVSVGDYVITREEFEACCLTTPMAGTWNDVPESHRNNLMAGIDWGAGGRARTVLTIGYPKSGHELVIVRMERFRGTEDPGALLEKVAAVCRRFRVGTIAADGAGNGYHLNRLLQDKLRPGLNPDFYAIVYSNSETPPAQDGSLWRWTVNRSGSIGNVFARIKKQLNRFPSVNDVRPFIEDFTCETTSYDEQQRSIKYTHPETQPDDALHATNYLQLIALRYMSSRRI